MSRKEKDRESRFFSGNEKELQEIKIRERLQKLHQKRITRRQLAGTARFILFVILAVLFVSLCFALFFRVKHVEVEGSTRYSAEEILAAADIEIGTNLFKADDEDLLPILEKLAYVKEVKLSRKLPDTVVISITEDEAQYVSEIYGQMYLLSSKLRVLEAIDKYSEIGELGLVRLYLPNVDSALIGKQLVFPDEVTDNYVTAYVQALAESPMLKITTAFDLRQRFDLALIAEDRYLVDLGTGTELSTKLTVVAGMLENPVFDDEVPATIDATNPEQCSVIKNSALRVGFDS